MSAELGELIQLALKEAHRVSLVPRGSGRELYEVITKLEEAAMWHERAPTGRNASRFVEDSVHMWRRARA